MAIVTDVFADRTIEMPNGTGSLCYSPRLVQTNNHVPVGYATVEPRRVDFYDTLKVAAVMAVAHGKLMTPSDANEAQEIYAQKSFGAKRLRDVEEFKDHFGNNNENWYAWEETLTGLRFREADLCKRYEIGDKITAEVIVTDITPYFEQIADRNFTRENWKDIVEKINQIKGEVCMPYSRGHVIREMDPLGIFTEVEQTREHEMPLALHGWLIENLAVRKDSVTDRYDIAVRRWSGWLHDGGGCLGVAAGCARSYADSDGGFRPVVRGSSPKIEQKLVEKPVVESANELVQQLDPRGIEQAFLEKIRTDYRSMPHPDFLKKYKLNFDTI
ncbi:MAG: hypothetical protein HY832_01360 [Candidatus Aenigmarchaeota archaeon]|nr:hypothetical protein [Candidatus Aenigmarchaeota archaeon]